MSAVPPMLRSWLSGSWEVAQPQGRRACREQMRSLAVASAGTSGRKSLLLLALVLQPPALSPHVSAALSLPHRSPGRGPRTAGETAELCAP